MIYCTQTIFKNPDYMEDDEWLSFMDDVMASRTDWKYLAVGGGDQDFLLVKSDLYEALQH